MSAPQEKTHYSLDLEATLKLALTKLDAIDEFVALLDDLRRCVGRNRYVGNARRMIRLPGVPAEWSIREGWARLGSFTEQLTFSLDDELIAYVFNGNPARKSDLVIDCGPEWEPISTSTRLEGIAELGDRLAGIGRQCWLDYAEFEADGRWPRSDWWEDRWNTVPHFDSSRLRTQVSIEIQNAVLAAKRSEQLDQEAASPEGPAGLGRWRWKGELYPLDGTSLMQTMPWTVAKLAFESGVSGAHLDAIGLNVDEDGMLEWPNAKQAAKRANDWFRGHGIGKALRADNPRIYWMPE